MRFVAARAAERVVPRNTVVSACHAMRRVAARVPMLLCNAPCSCSR